MNHVHFIGIGGVGMSGLAQALLSRGVRVSGSDPHANAATERLAAQGATVYAAQTAENITRERPELVVATAAIPADNPELAGAREAGISVEWRAEFLGRLMAEYAGPTVAVAGTHGKTTTTAMAAEVLLAGGLDPTVLVGAEYAPIGGNARIGSSPAFLTEACEAYDSFLSLHPQITVLTNVEADHLDHYGTEDNVFAGFRKFVLQTTGTLIWCSEDSGALRMVHYELQLDEGPRRVSYGFAPYSTNSVWAEDVVSEGRGSSYTLRWQHEGAALPGTVRVTLNVPGRHNVLNSLAAAAVGLEAGIDVEAIARGIASFEGTERRFETLGEVDRVLVIDDYAHHPTEITATLAAARAAYPDRRLIVVFQPHLYSRTRDFMDQFAESLGEADAVVITDIYPAREKPIPGVNVTDLVRKVAERAPDRTLLYAPTKAEAVDALRWLCREGDLVLTMGAGDIREVGEKYLSDEEAQT
jgi:UDP-N-acetylmuramate--alanine ligase